MPVPIVNVVVVILRQSINPINRFLIKTFMSGQVHEYERQLGFRFFKQFGHVCDKSESAIRSAAKKGADLTKKLKGGQQVP